MAGKPGGQRVEALRAELGQLANHEQAPAVAHQPGRFNSGTGRVFLQPAEPGGEAFVVGGMGRIDFGFQVLDLLMQGFDVRTFLHVVDSYQACVGQEAHPIIRGG